MECSQRVAASGGNRRSSELRRQCTFNVARERFTDVSIAVTVILSARQICGTRTQTTRLAPHPNAMTGQGILVRMRWRVPWPRGKVGDIRVSLVSFPICLRFRRLMIGLDVPVSAECEPDKSNRHEDSASYDQPIWIVSHLSVPSSRKPSRTGGSLPHSGES
jgi:hypothetical protein